MNDVEMAAYLAACNPWGAPMRSPEPEQPPVTSGLTIDKAKDPVVRALPAESTARKATPIVTGVLDYFPAAIAAVARVSKAGNDKHNPGEKLHHSRGKSTDHADAIGRHLMERGGIDPDTGERHSAELAWRALANLQQELEDAGEAPLARGASYDGIVLPGESKPPATMYDDIIIDQSVLDEVRRQQADHAEDRRREYSEPATPADQDARRHYNDGVLQVADWLSREGRDDLAELALNWLAQ